MSPRDKELTAQKRGQTKTMEENSTGNPIHNPVQPSDVKICN